MLFVEVLEEHFDELSVAFGQPLREQVQNHDDGDAPIAASDQAEGAGEDQPSEASLLNPHDQSRPLQRLMKR